MKSWGTDLEDGVHNACERSVMGVLCNFEDIQAPFVDILQVLLQEAEFKYHRLKNKWCYYILKFGFPSLTFDSRSSWSVLTPKRLPEHPETLEVWLSFLTPLIWVIIPLCCCCCCWPCRLFLSLDLGTEHGSSSSVGLSAENRTRTHKMKKTEMKRHVHTVG